MDPNKFRIQEPCRYALMATGPESYVLIYLSTSNLVLGCSARDPGTTWAAADGLLCADKGVDLQCDPRKNVDGLYFRCTACSENDSRVTVPWFFVLFRSHLARRMRRM